MALPKLNIRQTIEGMPLTFNSEAAAGFKTIIQFDITDEEPGIYHLSITDGECTFHTGPVDEPTLTIKPPSDVWLQISRGELSGQDALMQGLYTASGDLSLLLKMNSLFTSSDDASFEASPSQRPAGPIPLPGMAWMAVAFIPWILHWITFDIPGVSHWISVGLPLLLSVLIVGYRLIFDRPTWMEWGGLGFFTLAGVLTLTGDTGFSHWGSIVSSVVMAGLWLSSLQFSKTPLSAEYSKWGFVRALWRNSMFLYPNAVISLMWGWQFIVASFLGIVALLLPEQRVVFTVTRYLLLAPAFIFTSIYQKRALQLKVDDYEKTFARLRFWAGLGLSAVSGLLLTAAMPGFDVGLLGWIALVPLLIVITTAPAKQQYVLALPFGLLLSIGVHNWYPNIFPPALGYFLIFAVGTFYAGMLQIGAWLYTRLPKAWKLLAFPVTWVAIEFVRFIAPVVEDWWFVLLAKSMWRFPPALQILSVTGFVGLSFIVMLANVAIAGLVIKNQEIPKRASISALILVAIILIGGALIIPNPPAETFTIAALTDMSGADPTILAQGSNPGIEGPFADTPEISQALFDVNANLTRQATAESQPAFIVWPENEFADADAPQFMGQLGNLANETGAYIMADTVWRTPTEMYDAALLMGTDGIEESRWAKIRLFPSEADYGFSAGERIFHVVETPHGKVGGGVCYDYHYIDVVRGLARNGAQIVLMPTDDNFSGTPWFPPFHASDGVFRAAEHRVSFASGTVNGLAVVADPYGRITAEGEINERGVIIGETFIASGQTLYTRWGDWFGWLMVLGLLLLMIYPAIRK